MTIQELTDTAAELILGRMQQNQPVSIKTIDSWIQAGMTMPGNRARSIACAAALQDLVARGAIRRQDGGYAPGVTEGYVLVVQ